MVMEEVKEEVEMKVEVEMKEECENDKLLMIGEQIEEYVKPLSKNICQSKYLQIFTWAPSPCLPIVISISR